MRAQHLRRAGLVALAAGAALGMAACSSTANPATEDEAAAAGSRVAIGVPNGVLVLDGETLEVVDEFSTEEFIRLNPAGDGRGVMVTTSEGFQVLDTAAGTTGAPELTDLVFEADTAGHVVVHGDKTLLYADGTSDTTIFTSADLFANEGELPEVETIAGVEAHHGVSIELEDGTFMTTVGDADGRSGITVLDADGTEIATNDQCPGVHGEGTAADEAAVFGCENGALVVKDGRVTKLDAPDQPYGRMGNVFGTETSSFIIGDYKHDQDAEGYLLHEVVVLDTAAETYEVVHMPEGAEYTFRDLARGPGDLGYILGSDGAIHVLDPETGEFTDAFPVIEAWEGPVEWQDAHPAIKVDGDIAYVTEPASNEVHAVDLTTGEVLASVTLDATPNEIAVASSR